MNYHDDMMRYSELLESEILREVKTFELPSMQGDIRVWENPSLGALKSLQGRLGDLRGVTFQDGRYWVWRAFAATHHDVRKPNELPTEAHFLISGPKPHDEGWTLGTWGYSDAVHATALWIDRRNVPPRLKDMFPVLLREPEIHPT